VRLLIIRHQRERSSQSNTGNLVHRVVSGTEVVDYTALKRPPNPVSLWQPDTEYRVLFPIPGAELVSPATFTGKGSPTLVILDGNWRQARRMSRRIPGLHAFPFVTVPGTPPLRRLRAPIRPGQLSTADAVARALELLGYTDEAHQLQAALDLLVARVLHVRGQGNRRALTGGTMRRSPA
jgi:DTW domain-containing protein YfiP